MHESQRLVRSIFLSLKRTGQRQITLISGSVANLGLRASPPSIFYPQFASFSQRGCATSAISCLTPDPKFRGPNFSRRCDSAVQCRLRPPPYINPESAPVTPLPLTKILDPPLVSEFSADLFGCSSFKEINHQSVTDNEPHVFQYFGMAIRFGV